MCVTNKHLDLLQTSSFDLFCSLSTGMFLSSPPPSCRVAFEDLAEMRGGFEQSPHCSWDKPIPQHQPCLPISLWALASWGWFSKFPLLCSRHGVTVTLPFLRRRKFVVLVVEEKNTSGQNKPKSNPRCVAFYFKHPRLIWGRTRLLTFRSTWGWQSRQALPGQG